MTYPISVGANLGSGAKSVPDYIRVLAQTIAKGQVESTCAVTDDSSGAAQNPAVLLFSTPAVSVADAGSQLATAATIVTAVGAVLNAIKTLFTVLNTACSHASVPQITYNGTGTDGSGTVAAVTATVAGAATGTTAATFQPVADLFDECFYIMGLQLQALGIAVGDSPAVVNVTFDPTTLAAVHATLVVEITIPTIATAIAALASASTGMTAVAASANITVWMNNIATIAAALNTYNTSKAPLFVCVA